MPLSAEELERAINEPAHAVGVLFEDGLVSRIVSDVHYQPRALPLSIKILWKTMWKLMKKSRELDANLRFSA